MSIRYYGIYLAYPPTVDLRCEGLGRHLAAFLKGAAENKNIKFVIICPSWSKKSIYDLCRSENVQSSIFNLVTPPGYNILLRFYEYYLELKKYILKRRNNKSRANRIRTFFSNKKAAVLDKVFTARKLSSLLYYSVLLSAILLMHIIYSLSTFPVVFLEKINSIKLPKKIKKIFSRINNILSMPKNSNFIFQYYKLILDKESQLMLDIIDNMKNIRAWYCPTAFWPEFNKIKGPKLLCVPDFVVGEFPVGFSMVSSDRMFDAAKSIERTIYTGDHFITYSNQIKKEVLINRFNINYKKISVVPHAANTLDKFINFEGNNTEKATLDFCRKLLTNILLKSSNKNYSRGFQNTSVKFLFYASQARPSKNILTLIKAYKYLLRNRYINHKLILTANIKEIKEINSFISKHHLHKDILFVHGLTVQELAACYKLADIAVNPSISEGGCPFTLTEALSVGTPIIMADIPVTTEIITDPDLQELMLFNPYSWQDLAERIEWALKNKKQLLDYQLPVYQQLSKRTWTNVVNEYLEIMDELAEGKEKNLSQLIQPEIELCPA